MSTHSIIVNRLLANYVITQLEEEEYTDYSCLVSMHGLATSDRLAIRKQLQTRLRQLERASKPLGPRMVNWVDELVAEM